MKKEINVDTISNSMSKIVGIIIVVGLCLLFAFSIVMVMNLAPVDSTSDESVMFVIEKGWSKSRVIKELKKEKLIKNEFFFKLYLKTSSNNNFYAGTYLLSKNMDAKKIINILSNTSTIDTDSITVTFVEGKRFPYYAKKISETFNISEEEIYNKTSDQEYLKKLIDEYWFITDEILDENIYYPLEGYLFPDTYSFKKESTIEDIIRTLLNEMDKRLSIYKEEITLSNKSVHSLLTLASMVELEAVSAEDRVLVASVFNNRLKVNMTMGSDVTTYYAVKKEMIDTLTKSDLNSCNAYNTRGTCVKGLPIGPIASPSYSSITAAIEPTESEYYYFVADKENKVYFSKTSEEQAKVISELKKNNMWA